MLLGSGRGEGGVLWRLRLRILIAVIMLALTLPLGSTLGAQPVFLPDSRGVTTDVRALSSSLAPSQIPSVAPSVAYTLDLCTNHLYSGNALPTDCSGAYPWSVAYDSGKGEVFVVQDLSNNVSVVSDATNTVVATIPVGSSPEGVAYDSGKGEVFVTSYDSNTVSVISDASNTVVATIPVGPYPEGVAYDSGKGEVFVANSNCPSTGTCGQGTVSMISDSTNTVLTTLLVGTGPMGVAYDSGKGEVFVTNKGSDNVSMISDAMNKVVATISVGSEPVGVAYDNGKGEAFIANYGSNNVNVISDANNTVTTTITIGSAPAFAAYDLSNGHVYVSNFGQGTISIITTSSSTSTYPVNFSESGLSAGTTWSVTLNGQTLYSSTSTISFNAANGMLAFTVGTVRGYTGSPSSGSVTVNGTSQTVYIAFTPSTAAINAVTFNESGLPPGTIWSVTLSSLTLTSTTSAITFNEANGTYAYTVGAVSGYTLSPSSGSVTVNGASQTVFITSTPSTTSTFAVTFSESGLQSGTSWSVTLNGQSLSSATSIIFFSEPNGTYSYTVGTVSGYTAAPSFGSVRTNGVAISVTITFTPSTVATYAVTFPESGLPNGISWSVTLNGAIKSGTGNIVFTEPNGTYTFTVGTVSGYTASPSSGSFTVSGVAVSKAITFTALPPGRYSLIFSETGLPAGTNWSVTVGTTTYTSTGSTISFTETNGTYTYTVGSVTGYTATPSSGSVSVNGAAKTVSLKFAKASAGTTYAVTFSESGLPSGTSWSVALNGSTKSSTSVTITFQEANGSYVFTVGSVSGYAASPASGSVKVTGVAASQSITFSSSTPNDKTNQNSGPLGLPGYDGYILIGVIIAAVLAAITALLLRKGRGKKGTPGYGVQDSKNIADGAASQVAVE